MKCKACRKEIVFDHYVATTGSDPDRPAVQLILKCGCGLYLIPFDFIHIGKRTGFVSSEKIKRLAPSKDRSFDGRDLSQEGLEIYNTHGKQAYEKWKEEVFFPLMDSRLKRLRALSNK